MCPSQFGVWLGGWGSLASVSFSREFSFHRFSNGLGLSLGLGTMECGMERRFLGRVEWLKAWVQPKPGLYPVYIPFLVQIFFWA